jgi:hypothetical protein
VTNGACELELFSRTKKRNKHSKQNIQVGGPRVLDLQKERIGEQQK